MVVERLEHRVGPLRAPDEAFAHHRAELGRQPAAGQEGDQGLRGRRTGERGERVRREALRGEQARVGAPRRLEQRLHQGPWRVVGVGGRREVRRELQHRLRAARRQRLSPARAAVVRRQQRRAAVVIDHHHARAHHRHAREVLRAHVRPAHRAGLRVEREDITVVEGEYGVV